MLVSKQKRQKIIVEFIRSEPKWSLQISTVPPILELFQTYKNDLIDTEALT